MRHEEAFEAVRAALARIAPHGPDLRAAPPDIRAYAADLVVRGILTVSEMAETLARGFELDAARQRGDISGEQADALMRQMRDRMGKKRSAPGAN